MMTSIPAMPLPVSRRLYLALPAAAACLWAAPLHARQPSTPVLPGHGQTILIEDPRNGTNLKLLTVPVRQALSSELEQSPFFDVVPETKIRKTLQALGSDAGGQGLMAACKRLGGNALLQSTISPRGDRFVIALTARDCTSGKVLAEARGEADGQGQLVTRLALVTSKMRAGLGEPAGSIRRFGATAALGTTSLKALDSYASGIAAQKEKGDVESVPLFEEAIRADPDFPMPSVALSSAFRNLRQPENALRSATKAYSLRSRVSERARLQIEAAYHSATGNLDEEIATYRRWTTTYPLDFAAHNNLGDDYFGLGRLDESLVEYEKAVRLAPTIAGYSNVIGAYLSLDRFAEARRAYDEAAALALDGRYVRQNLYWLSFVLGDAPRMDEQVRWAAGKPGDEDVLLSLKSDTEAYYGRMTDARVSTRGAIASALRANASDAAALWQVNAALREAELGNRALAVEGAHGALKLSNGRDIRMFAALALARAGEAAGARSLLADLERDYPTATLMKLYWFPTIRAAIALGEANGAAALKELQGAQAYELGGAGTTINYLYPAYLRGSAYLANGQYEAAELEFKKLVDHPGIVINFVTGALANLQLARAYARNGETSRARTSYDHFLAIWKGADPELDLLKAATEERSSIN